MKNKLLTILLIFVLALTGCSSGDTAARTNETVVNLVEDPTPTPTPKPTPKISPSPTPTPELVTYDDIKSGDYNEQYVYIKCLITNIDKSDDCINFNAWIDNGDTYYDYKNWSVPSSNSYFSVFSKAENDDIYRLLVYIYEDSSFDASTIKRALKLDDTVDTPTPEPTPKLTEEEFLENIKILIDGSVGKKEIITDVILQNSDLCIFVDLSQIDPSPLTIEDIAFSRTSSITDEILDLNEYYNLWETITVDFGSLGYISNDKSDITDDGYGPYFESSEFILE